MRWYKRPWKKTKTNKRAWKKTKTNKRNKIQQNKTINSFPSNTSEENRHNDKERSSTGTPNTPLDEDANHAFHTSVGGITNLPSTRLKFLLLLLLLLLLPLPSLLLLPLLHLLVFPQLQLLLPLVIPRRQRLRLMLLPGWWRCFAPRGGGGWADRLWRWLRSCGFVGRRR